MNNTEPDTTKHDSFADDMNTEATSIDPLTLTLASKNGDIFNDIMPMAGNIFNVIALKAQSATGLDTLRALRKRILEYIHVRSLENKGSRLVDLNRRFHRPATKLGVTTTNCVEHLMSNGHLTKCDYEGKTAYVAASIYKEMCAVCSAAGIPEHETIGDFVQNS